MNTDVTKKVRLGVVQDTGTAADCKVIGHCLHPGTAVGSLWCCRCGQYFYPEQTFKEVA